MKTVSFWEERPLLSQIHQYAQARRVSPWAMFGGVLTRIIAATEPHVQLPPIVGGPGSLNFFVGIVGRSGQGKGASQAAAASFIDIYRGALFDTVTVGSGEGIAASYVRRVKDEAGNLVPDQHTESALFDVAEVDTLSALAGRQGSTLLSELRKVWSGERLGFQNRDQSRTLPVDAHSYRASLIVGIQPTRAGAILSDVDGGTPQRFIWLPATDDHAPDRAPVAPEMTVWTAPGENVIPTIDGRRTMGVCDLAWRTIDEAQVSSLRGEGDALDGHALFSRLKVAAALSLLDGRGVVSEDDWRLAGDVMAVSDATRASCREAIRQQSVDESRGRAEVRAEANVITADHTETVAINKAKDRILGKLTSSWVSASQIRSSLTKALQGSFYLAVDDLGAEGIIEVQTGEYQGQPQMQLRLPALTERVSPGKTQGLSALPVLPRDSGDSSPGIGSPGSPGDLQGLRALATASGEVSR